MTSIEVTEIGPGEFRLYLIAGTTAVDGVAVDLGHEPNGPFRAGVTALIVAVDAPGLEGRFWTDSEAGAFLAHSEDRPASAKRQRTKTACASW
jgi:hypothetical protein